MHVHCHACSSPYTLDDPGALIDKMHKEWRVLSMTDLVFNHTAKDSPWLMQHPEAAFNLANSPHLRPAYIIDRILYYFSQEVGEGKWESMGVPASITEEGHLQVIVFLILTTMLATSIKLQVIGFLKKVDN